MRSLSALHPNHKCFSSEWHLALPFTSIRMNPMTHHGASDIKQNTIVFIRVRRVAMFNKKQRSLAYSRPVLCVACMFSRGGLYGRKLIRHLSPCFLRQGLSPSLEGYDSQRLAKPGTLQRLLLLSPRCWDHTQACTGLGWNFWGPELSFPSLPSKYSTNWAIIPALCRDEPTVLSMPKGAWEGHGHRWR